MTFTLTTPVRMITRIKIKIGEICRGLNLSPYAADFHNRYSNYNGPDREFILIIGDLWERLQVWNTRGPKGEGLRHMTYDMINHFEVLYASLESGNYPLDRQKHYILKDLRTIKKWEVEVKSKKL